MDLKWDVANENAEQKPEAPPVEAAPAMDAAPAVSPGDKAKEELVRLKAELASASGPDTLTALLESWARIIVLAGANHWLSPVGVEQEVEEAAKLSGRTKGALRKTIEDIRKRADAIGEAESLDGARFARDARSHWLLTKVIPEINKRYVQWLDSAGTAIVYRVGEGNEVAFQISTDRLTKDVYSIVQSAQMDGGGAERGSTMALADEALRLWNRVGQEIKEQPALVLFASQDPDCFTFRRLPFDPAPGDWSAWKEFDSRLTAPDVWRAYVWSCFQGRNEGRQIVWLHGKEGQDGKSVVLRVIGEALGPNAVAPLSGAAVKEPRFLAATVFGKTLVTYSDCKNERILMSEFVRNVTSGDAVPIERKGEQPFFAILRARMIIASNAAPDLTSGGADQSRLIYLAVRPSQVKDDPSWAAKLKEQLPAYLHECRQDYEKLCPHHGQIALPDELRESRAALADEFEDEFAGAFSRYFESCACYLHPVNKTHPEGRCVMGAAEFSEIVRDEFRDTMKVKEFKGWIERKGLGEFKRNNAHGRHCRGFARKGAHEGFKLKEPTQGAPDMQVQSEDGQWALKF